MRCRACDNYLNELDLTEYEGKVQEELCLLCLSVAYEEDNSFFDEKGEDLWR